MTEEFTVEEMLEVLSHNPEMSADELIAELTEHSVDWVWDNIPD